VTHMWQLLRGGKIMGFPDRAGNSKRSKRRSK
jgi:hypothetical protein